MMLRSQIDEDLMAIVGMSVNSIHHRGNHRLCTGHPFPHSVPPLSACANNLLMPMTSRPSDLVLFLQHPIMSVMMGI